MRRSDGASAIPVSIDVDMPDETRVSVHTASEVREYLIDLAPKDYAQIMYSICDMTTDEAGRMYETTSTVLVHVNYHVKVRSYSHEQVGSPILVQIKGGEWGRKHSEMYKNSKSGVKQFGTSIPYVSWHQHGPMAVSGREGTGTCKQGAVNSRDEWLEI